MGPRTRILRALKGKYDDLCFVFYAMFITIKCSCTDYNSLFDMWRYSVRQVLKYALVIVMYVYGCPIHIILSLEIAPVSAKTKAPNRYSAFPVRFLISMDECVYLIRFLDGLHLQSTRQASTWKSRWSITASVPAQFAEVASVLSSIRA